MPYHRILRTQDPEELKDNMLSCIPAEWTELLGPPVIVQDFNFSEHPGQPSMRLRWTTAEGWEHNIEMWYTERWDPPRSYEGPLAAVGIFLNDTEMRAEGSREADDTFADLLWGLKARREKPDDYPEWYGKKVEEDE